MSLKRNIHIERVNLVMLGLVTFFVTSWTLERNFYFLFDDIAWLRNVKFSFDFKNFFSIFPISRYNDRPLRTLFFWVMYNLFGLNYTAYYLVVLLWHVINTYLVFFLIKEIQKKCNVDVVNSYWRSLVVAIWFGIYPKNLMAVYWIAGAANDLLCGFFSLLSMIMYLKYMNNRKVLVFGLFSLIFYIFAMRSKEAAICLPVIILIFELYFALLINRQKIKINWVIISLLLYMLMYLIRIFTLPSILTNEGQYKQDFSLGVIISVLFNYIRMYFAWDDGSFSYDILKNYTKVGNIGILICFLIFFIEVANLIKTKSKQSVCILLLFLISSLALAPLLILPNIQHLLYFYFPAVFLSTLFGFVLYDGFIFLFGGKWSNYIFTIIILGSLLVLNNVGGAKRIRENFLTWGKEALSTVKELKEIEKLPENTQVYLHGADKDANVFNYSPGYISNIIWDTPTIKTTLITDEEFLDLINSYEGSSFGESYKVPFVVWDYKNGHVKEILRVIDE